MLKHLSITHSNIKKYVDIHTTTSKYGVVSLDIELLPFHDKETYLAWRAAWRGAYTELSTYIREQKRIRSTKGPERNPVAASGAQANASDAGFDAKKMLEQRAASKVKTNTIWKSSRIITQPQEELCTLTT